MNGTFSYSPFCIALIESDSFWSSKVPTPSELISCIHSMVLDRTSSRNLEDFHVTTTTNASQLTHSLNGTVSKYLGNEIENEPIIRYKMHDILFTFDTPALVCSCQCFSLLTLSFSLSSHFRLHLSVCIGSKFAPCI